jgi:UDP-2,3-diacylglucosamine hydrolase
MRRVFLSDVHLSPREPERTARLVRFLEREAPRTAELYILGDLFDYWIGPRHLDLPDYREALDALRRAVAGGMAGYFLLGNRDFYMRRRFAAETGLRIVPGRTEHRLETGGRRVYLCHGDYMEGRRGLGFAILREIRSRPVEAVFTRLPVAWQEWGARFYRGHSGRRTRQPKAGPAHLGPHGLYEPALLAEFARGTDLIVCGHVHRAGEWRLDAAGPDKVLYTLGDWSDGEGYLEEEDGQWRLCGGAARSV